MDSDLDDTERIQRVLGSVAKFDDGENVPSRATIIYNGDYGLRFVSSLFLSSFLPNAKHAVTRLKFVLARV